MRERIKVTTFGGGSGQSTLLSALRQLPYVSATAVVTPFDSSGSSRKLRDQFDVLPYGDIQRCVFALSPFEHVRDIFSARLDLPGLSAPYHTGGNLLLSALEQDFRQHMDVEAARRLAIRALEQMFKATGQVHPAALSYTNLCAEFENGKIATHEHEVDEFIQAGGDLVRLYLADEVPANRDAIDAVSEADILIVGPGSWYTSVLPPLLPIGMKEAITEAKTPIVWVMNLLSEGDDMASWKGATYIRQLMHYVGRVPAVLLVNSMDIELPESYRKERKLPIASMRFRSYGNRVFCYPLSTVTGVPRHDPDKLASALGLLLPTVLV